MVVPYVVSIYKIMGFLDNSKVKGVLESSKWLQILIKIDRIIKQMNLVQNCVIFKSVGVFPTDVVFL